MEKRLKWALTTNFSMQIPLIKKAQQLRGSKTLSFYTSPWSAPPWMKSVQGWSGPGVLKPEFYQVWANYAVRFFEEYEKHNISFWGMTVGNEPYLIGFTPPPNEVPAMGWTIYKLVFSLSKQFMLSNSLIFF